MLPVEIPCGLSALLLASCHRRLLDLADRGHQAQAVQILVGILAGEPPSEPLCEGGIRKGVCGGIFQLHQAADPVRDTSLPFLPGGSEILHGNHGEPDRKASRALTHTGYQIFRGCLALRAGERIHPARGEKLRAERDEQQVKIGPGRRKASRSGDHLRRELSARVHAKPAGGERPEPLPERFHIPHQDQLLLRSRHRHIEHPEFLTQGIPADLLRNRLLPERRADGAGLLLKIVDAHAQFPVQQQGTAGVLRREPGREPGHKADRKFQPLALVDRHDADALCLLVTDADLAVIDAVFSDLVDIAQKLKKSGIRCFFKILRFLHKEAEIGAPLISRGESRRKCGKPGIIEDMAEKLVDRHGLRLLPERIDPVEKPGAFLPELRGNPASRRFFGFLRGASSFTA